MAKDLNSLSDEELIKMAGKQGVFVPKTAAGSLEEMSDDDLLKLADLSGVSPEPENNQIANKFSPFGPVVGALEKVPYVGEIAKQGRIGAESALSSMTLGLSDPAINSLDALSDVASNPKNLSIQGLKDAYSTAAAKRLQEREQNPLIQTAGNIAGVVSPIGAVSKGAGLIGKGAKAIAPAGMLAKGLVGLGEGAAVGGLSGAGNYAQQKVEALSGTGSEDIAPLSNQLAMGVGAGVAGKAVGSILSKSADKLSDFAKSKAAKSIGFMKKDLPKSSRLSYGDAKKRMLDIGESAIENDLVKPGANVEKIAAKSEGIVDDYIKKIGQFYKDSAEAFKQKNLDPAVKAEGQALMSKFQFQPKTLANKIESGIVDDLNRQDLPEPAQEKITNAVKPWLDKMRSFGDETDISRLNNFRKTIDKQITWTRKEMPEAEEYLAKIRSSIVEDIQDKLANLSSSLGGTKAKEIQNLNKNFSKMIDIAKVSKDRALTEEFANRGISLTDYISGAGGAATGAVVGGASGKDVESGLKGAVLGAGLGLLNKGARRYGNPLLTTGAYNLAPQLGLIGETLPKTAGKVGGLLAPKKKEK